MTESSTHNDPNLDVARKAASASAWLMGLAALDDADDIANGRLARSMFGCANGAASPRVHALTACSGALGEAPESFTRRRALGRSAEASKHTPNSSQFRAATHENHKSIRSA